MKGFDATAVVSTTQTGATASLGALMLAQADKPWTGIAGWFNYFGVMYPNLPPCCIEINSAADVVFTKDGIATTFQVENLPTELTAGLNANAIFLHTASGDCTTIIKFRSNKRPNSVNL